MTSTRRTDVVGVAEWLGLAATPAFAAMALLTIVFGGGPMDKLCSAKSGPLLSGMAPMYLLMSAVHAAPWLKWVFMGRDRGLRRGIKMLGGSVEPKAGPGVYFIDDMSG